MGFEGPKSKTKLIAATTAAAAAAATMFYLIELVCLPSFVNFCILLLSVVFLGQFPYGCVEIAPVQR